MKNSISLILMVLLMLTLIMTGGILKAQNKKTSITYSSSSNYNLDDMYPDDMEYYTTRVNKTKTKPIMFGIHIGSGHSYKFKKESSSASTGFAFGMIIYGVGVDIGSNYQSGKGEYLKFDSNKTYKTSKTDFLYLNIGYSIPLITKSGKYNLYINPVVGYYSEKDIYEDPILWDTYFYKETKSAADLGIYIILKANYNAIGNVYLKVGGTTNHISAYIGIGI